MDANQAFNVVVETLEHASSQNSAVLKPAEKQLTEWESQPGFYTILLNIFSDKSLSVNIRWLAVLYFKNGVDRYWRRHSSEAISEEEKVVMRRQLMSNFHEPVNQLAIQLAVLVGKIARLDCPKQWPDLLPTLLEEVRTCTDELRQQRVLLTFYQVVKCLSSRRLAHDRKVFEELTREIFEFVLGLWNNQMLQFDQLVGKNEVRGAQVMLEYAHLTLKVLRKLVVYGFRDASKEEKVGNFLHQCLVAIEKVSLCREVFDVSSHMNDKRNKLLLLFSKIVSNFLSSMPKHFHSSSPSFRHQKDLLALLDVLQYHPDAYIPLINPTLELVVKFCFSQDAPLVPEYERFNVNLLNLMKDITRNDYYRPTLNRNDADNQLALAAHKCIVGSMTGDRLVSVINRIIYNYLPLTSADLELWDSDPEEYVNEEGGDSWKYSLRACVETLYVTLFKEYREIVGPHLLSIMKDTERPCRADDIRDVLTRDALYNSVGLANYEIYDDVDFDSWMKNHLVNELQIPHPNYRIIRRRVIWLIGNWVSVKVSGHTRPLIYSSVLSLLQPTEDLVVRLEAALTLKAAIDDVEYTTEQFSQYLDSTFHMLFKLLTDVMSCDSKMQVLHVMSFVIERVGADIAPHASSLIQHLPLLWQESEEHNLLRCAIVSTLVHLIEGLGSSSTQLHTLILPVIRLSTDMNQSPHVYLLEDGLDLWKSLLYNTSQVSPDILSLFSAMPALLECGTENLRICLKIIEAYTLLCGEELLLNYGQVLVASLCSLVTDMKSEGLIQVYKTVEVIFKMHVKQAAPMFQDLFVYRIIAGILDGEEFPMVMGLYLSLVSRVTLENKNLFFLYIMEFAKNNDKPQEQVLNDFLQMWFERLECISQTERRKICAIAIASLIPTALGSNATTLDPMVNACVQVLHDVCSCHTSGDSTINTDTLVCDSQQTLELSASESEAVSLHEKRKLQMAARDPIYHVHLDRFVFTKINELKAFVSEESFQQLFACIDSDISSQLQTFMRPFTKR